jgi:hypothetical protein
MNIFAVNLKTLKHLTKSKYKIIVTIIAILLFGILVPMIFRFFDVEMSVYGIYLYWCIALGFFYLLPDLDSVIII